MIISREVTTALCFSNRLSFLFFIYFSFIIFYLSNLLQTFFVFIKSFSNNSYFSFHWILLREIWNCASISNFHSAEARFEFNKDQHLTDFHLEITRWFHRLMPKSLENLSYEWLWTHQREGREHLWNLNLGSAV